MINKPQVNVITILEANFYLSLSVGDSTIRYTRHTKSENKWIYIDRHEQHIFDHNLFFLYLVETSDVRRYQRRHFKLRPCSPSDDTINANPILTLRETWQCSHHENIVFVPGPKLPMTSRWLAERKLKLYRLCLHVMTRSLADSTRISWWSSMKNLQHQREKLPA